MTEYREDNIVVKDDTDIEDLIEYIEDRTANPIEIGDVIVFDYSTHKTDMEALENAVQNKLQRGMYQIPMQVTTGNILVQSLIPYIIRDSEILIYREEKEEYYAYKNHCRSLTQEQKTNVRLKLAENIDQSWVNKQ